MSEILTCNGLADDSPATENPAGSDCPDAPGQKAGPPTTDLLRRLQETEEMYRAVSQAVRASGGKPIEGQESWFDAVVRYARQGVEVEALRTAITAALDSAQEEDLDKHPRTGQEWPYVTILREAVEMGQNGTEKRE